MRFIVYLAFFLASSAHATIIRWDDAVIDGVTYTTFLDSESGHTWLTFENNYSAYYDLNPSDFEQALTGTGYHLASISESQQLFETNLGIREIQGNLDYYGEVFYGPGDYGDGFGLFGVGTAWAHDYTPDLYWFLGYVLYVTPSTLYGYGEDGALTGAQYWSSVPLIRSDVAAVPLPGAVWLFLTGLGLLGIRAKFGQWKAA